MNSVAPPPKFSPGNVTANGGYLFVVILFALLPWGCAGTPNVPPETLDQIDQVDCHASPCLDFIYIHGAALHSAEIHNRFKNQVDLLHQWMQVSLNATPEFREGALKHGKYNLNPVPKIDFWGNEKLLMEDLESINWMLTNEKRDMPSFLTGQRGRLAVDIHDLFWVGHSHHQPTLLTPLHNKVNESAKRGHPVVLLGHSAGSLIAANYALYRIPYIRLDELARLPETSDALRRFSTLTADNASTEH
jgi:hypothetical protein